MIKLLLFKFLMLDFHHISTFRIYPIMHKPLISLLTPCYNGESYLRPHLEALLKQTAENVEYIFVNDGSTDKSEQVLFEYREKLEAKGWKVVYLKKPNGGAADALNHGLKVFSGDYLTWVDSDDVLHPNFLTEMSEFLEENQQFGFCYAQTQYVKVEDPQHPYFVQKRVITDGERDNFFEDLILAKNLPALAFCMVRSRDFLRVNPTRSIYVSPVGQNAQMLLPMAKNFRCGYIPKVLSTYMVRQGSASHQINPLYDAMSEDVLLHVMQNLELKPWEEIYCKQLLDKRFHQNEVSKDQNFSLKLFGFIPLLKGKCQKSKTKIYLFGFIPFLSLKSVRK